MSRANLQSCKAEALRRLSPSFVLGLFEPELFERYGVCSGRVTFEHFDARRRIREAVLIGHTESEERSEELAGETDGDTIWVMRNMDREDTVATLLHEALHDSVYILRTTRKGTKRGLSCECEHRAMKRAGL